MLDEASGSSNSWFGEFEDDGSNTGKLVGFVEGESIRPWGRGFAINIPISSSKSSFAVGRKANLGGNSGAAGRGGMEFEVDVER